MPNPFESLFEARPGTQGTIEGGLGMIGRAFGVPTQQERYGSIQGRAMKELSELQEATGGTPQQTLTKFMQTPTGMELFASGDPSAMNVLHDWAKGVTKATPTITGTAPGHSTYETGPGYAKQVGQVPPTSSQEFDHFAKISKLPPEKLSELAQVWMLPQDQRTTAEERAIHGLIGSNLISKEIGLKILGKVIQVKPVLNKAGENTGDVSITDMSTNQVTVTRPRGNDDGNKGAGVVTEGNPAGFKDPDKLEMFLGTGAPAHLLSMLDSATRVVFGSHTDLYGGAGAKATNRNRYMKDIETALTMFPEGDGKTNLVIEQMKKYMPNTWGTDNLQAVRNGIRLREIAEREISVDERLTVSTVPKDQVIKAERRIEGYRAILRSLPEREDMVALEKKLLEGTADAHNLRSAGAAIYNAAGSVVAKPGDPANVPAPGETPTPAPKPGTKAQPRASRTAPEDDIATMPVAKLLQMDPATLPMDKRKQFFDRVKAVRAELARKKQ